MAKRFSAAGFQQVENLSPVDCEILGLGRAFGFSTDFQVMSSPLGPESILAIENGSIYSFVLDNVIFCTTGEAHFRLLLNTAVHNAPVPLLPISLNRNKVDGFHGDAFRADGSDTPGPVGGRLLTQLVVDGETVLTPTSLIVAPNDILVFAAQWVNPPGLVGVSVVGHHV